VGCKDRQSIPKGVQDGLGWLVKLSSVRVAKPGMGFSAAHFLVAHEKCSRLHGHNYRLRVSVRGEPGEEGMIMDFSKLTGHVRSLCEEIDHKVIVPSDSPWIKVLSKGEEIEIVLPDRRYSFPRSDVAFLPIRASTAEEMAKYFCGRLSKEIPGLGWVEVEESPGSVARCETEPVERT